MTIRRPVETSMGDQFFNSDFPLYVNRVSESFELQEHKHDFVEIAYVAEGSGFHYIGGQTIPVRKGDAFFIPVGTSHVFRPATAAKNRQPIVYNCIFQSQWFDRTLSALPSLLPETSANDLLLLRERNEWLHVRESHNEIAESFRILHEEYLIRQDGYETMLLSAWIRLMLLIGRLTRNVGLNPSDHERNSRIQEVLRYMEEYCREPITVTAMAKRIDIGERQLQRLLKQQTGLSFIRHLQALRVHWCCRQLQLSNMSVAEIAREAGYQDMKHFHAVFKRITGITPGLYRKNRQ